MFGFFQAGRNAASNPPTVFKPALASSNGKLEHHQAPKANTSGASVKRQKLVHDRPNPPQLHHALPQFHFHPPTPPCSQEVLPKPPQSSQQTTSSQPSSQPPSGQQTQEESRDEAKPKTVHQNGSISAEKGTINSHDYLSGKPLDPEVDLPTTALSKDNGPFVVIYVKRRKSGKFDTNFGGIYYGLKDANTAAIAMYKSCCPEWSSTPMYDMGWHVKLARPTCPPGHALTWRNGHGERQFLFSSPVSGGLSRIRIVRFDRAATHQHQDSLRDLPIQGDYSCLIRDFPALPKWKAGSEHPDNVQSCATTNTAQRKRKADSDLPNVRSSATSKTTRTKSKRK